MVHHGVLLRGLPFNCTVDDIAQFFNTLTIHKNAVEMVYMYNGRFSGIAYIKLRNRDEVKLSLLMDQNHIGDRYIDVMEVSEEKLEQIRESAIGGIRRLDLHRMCSSDTRPRANDMGSRGGRNSSGGRHVRERSRSPIQVKNLRTRFSYVTGFPQDTLYKGVRQFFDGCLIGPSCVHLFRAENDRFRGDGYIEFASSDELKKALKRNEAFYQGSHCITIEPCSEEEVNDMKPYMMETTTPLGRGGGNVDEGYGGYRGGSRDSYGGYRAESTGNFSRGGSSRGRESSHGHYGDYLHGRWGGDYRHGNRELGSIEHSSGSRHYSNNGGGKRDDLKRGYESHERYVNSSHATPVGGGQSSREKKTLRLQGLSPSTGISDIVTFFRNYGVEYESVRIQCYDDGTPNGRAFVTFASERIASAALHDMNRRLLKNSYVELAPVN